MGRATTLLPDARTLFAGGTVAGLSDGDLLDRVARRSPETSELAFTALVARHGPMVLGVCRRILASPHDVEDAFQATFLVLARRAGSVRVRDSLAPWLYGVSRRVATRARITVARRRARETPDVGRLPAVPDRDAAVRDLRSVIDDELARLPPRYRSVVVLCDLQDLSHEEASRQLRCPLGTIKSRLARGRERLRGRLTRRGLAPPAGALAAVLRARRAPAMLFRLSRATVRAATSHTMGGSATAGAFPASVSALAGGVLRAMVWTNLKWTAASLLMLCAAGSGSLALRSTRADDPHPAVTATESPTSPPIEQKLRRRVSLNLQDETLADALRFLNREYDLNLVLDPKALSDKVTTATKVSLKTTGVTLGTALTLLLKPLGLGFRVDDGIVLVSSFATGEVPATLSVYVSQAPQAGRSREDVLRFRERLIKDIERRTPYRVVASPDEADLIVEPTAKLRARWEGLGGPRE